MAGLNILEDLLRKMASAVPNILGAILLLVIGWGVARLVAKMLTRLMSKLKLDRFAERLNDIDIVRQNNLRISLSKILSKVVYYFLMLIFTVAATDVLGMEALSNLITDIINYIPQFVTALVLLMVGLLLADGIKSTVKSACESLGIPSASLIGGFVFWFVFLTIGVSALGQAGIDTQFIMSNLTVVLAGGVLAFSIGYGLASRHIVSNFLASFYNRGKITIGSTIAIDGAKGRVVHMDNSSFTLQADGKKIVLPLSKLTSEKIEIFEEQ